MKQMNLLSFNLLVCFLFLVSGSNAQNLSADEIMMKAHRAYKYLGDDGITMANMDIKDSKGKIIMNRELLLIKKNVDSGKKQKWYAYFKKPADIRKMVFMVWTNPEKDDDRWLFLPAMDLVKRLAGSDKRSSFAGSHFVYEDVTGRYPKLDTNELVESSGEYYEIKSIPKKKSGVEFSYYYSYVDKSNFLPMKQVYYDKNGEVHRVFECHKVGVIQNFPSTLEFSMTNVRTGESTYTTYSGVQYNVGIDDKLFTESRLRKTPRKWLKLFKK